LESVWPVHGSVLVKDDMVYLVAGRSMFLDGGLRLLCLDPVTGAKISESILDDRDPETGANLQIHVKTLNMPVALPDILSADDEYIFMRSQRFAYRRHRFGKDLAREQIPPHSGDHAAQGSQQYGAGVHLFSPYGFLDGTWFHRSYWVFGRSYASGAGGYYRAGRYAPAGRIMAFDDTHVYGFGRQPKYFKWTTPMEYQLFAAEKFPAGQSITYRWTDTSPSIFVRAMAVADEILFIAGPPDVVDEEHAFDNSADPNVIEMLDEQDAALKGAQGTLLRAVSVTDGGKYAEYNIASLPVWDGMVVANGRLFISMENGAVQSFAGANYPTGIQPVMQLSAGVGVSATRIRVGAWQDQAGANDAVQTVDDDRPSLIGSAINGMPAIGFDGAGQHLDVADSADINVGGPYSGKTLIVVFKTSSDIGNRQVIWEQGGAVRGLNFYLDAGHLHMTGWNLAETEWGPETLNIPVWPSSVYVATLILDAAAGTLEGSVNGLGLGIGAAGGVGQLHKHSDNCALGHVEGATMFHDGTTAGPANFSGLIADCRLIEGILMSKYGI